MKWLISGDDVSPAATIAPTNMPTMAQAAQGTILPEIIIISDSESDDDALVVPQFD
jgi:hypothetical protein